MFSQQHPKSITLSVGHSSKWKMLQSGSDAQGSPWWKTSGKDLRNHLRSCMQFLNFTSCPADPDVWMRPAIKSDGFKCYDYVLLNLDDALVASENAESILRNELGRYFELKEESIPPQIITWEAKSGQSNLKLVYMQQHSGHPNMFKQQ